MTVRRVDFVHLKPGRASDYIQMFQNFAGLLHDIGIEQATLVRRSASGIGPDQYYAFVDSASMEAYGEFMDRIRCDERIQRAWSGFFAEDSPCTYFGTSLLYRLASFGESESSNQGTSVIVRRWKANADAESAMISGFEQLQPHIRKVDGSFELWKLIASGPVTGDVVSAAIFPDTARLGKWMDMLMNVPDILNIITAQPDAEPPPVMLETSVDVVVTTSTA